MIHGWLQMLSHCSEFVEMTRALLGGDADKLPGLGSHSLWNNQGKCGLLALNPDPWKLHNTDELVEMMDNVSSLPVFPGYSSWPGSWEMFRSGEGMIRSHTKIFISAASLAIRFFYTLPRVVRMRVRQNVLHEAHVSVAQSASHCRGLIHFANENSKLQIVHHVELWDTVLAETQLEGIKQDEHGRDNSWPSPLLFHGNSPPCIVYRFLLTGAVEPWITEVLALEHSGMPAGSFSLVIEDETCMTQPVVDIMVEDLQWQEALEMWCSRHPPPRNTRHDHYVFHGFPKAMRNMLEGTGVIQSNNCSAELADPEHLLAMNRDLVRADMWWRRWSQLPSNGIKPAPPTTWLGILLEYALEPTDE